MTMAKTICEDCQKVYYGGPKSFFCPDCRKRRISEAAKARNLNKLGNDARSVSTKGGEAMSNQQNDVLQELKDACPNNVGVVCNPRERNCDACGWNPKVAKARREKRFPAAKTGKNHQNS